MGGIDAAAATAAIRAGWAMTARPSAVAGRVAGCRACVGAIERDATERGSDSSMVVICGFLGDQHPTLLPDTNDVMDCQSRRSGRWPPNERCQDRQFSVGLTGVLGGSARDHSGDLPTRGWVNAYRRMRCCRAGVGWPPRE